MWRWRRSLGWEQARRAGAVVPNAVEPRDFVRADDDAIRAFRERHAIPQGSFVCGRVAQPWGSKWHPQNLLAFGELARRDPAAHLILVGLPDSLRPVLEGSEPSIRTRVHELPLTTDDRELSLIYSSLDCFLHAAEIGESFGLVMAEAMLCGCPVVTASRPDRDNSQIEVVGHRQGGLIAASTACLGAALLSLREDEGLRREMRARARQRVIDLFAADRVAALAARVGELALGAEDRESLIRKLEDDPEIQTRTPDTQVRDLLRQTMGRPRRLELLRMRLVTRRPTQRLIQRINRWRFGGEE